MNPGQFILVTLFSVLGATAQGSIGIGYGMVAGAGLVAIDPSFVPGPLLIIGVIISVRHAVVEREHLDRGIWLRAMVGLPVGLFSGLAVLNAMSDRALGLAVGAAIAVASVALLLGLSVRRNPVMDRPSTAEIGGSKLRRAEVPLIRIRSTVWPRSWRSSASR